MIELINRFLDSRRKIKELENRYNHLERRTIYWREKYFKASKI